MSVVIETTLGDITVDLFIKERQQACLNFLKLCKLKYYNLNLFHNIEQNFIAQTGDPSGSGDGGESVWGVIEGSNKRFFEAESLPKIKHSTPGLLSLVSIGKNMVNSQFFFTLGEDLISLDNVHCVIGEVSEGHEVLRKLNEAIVDENFRPYQDIRITHTVVLEDPFDDPRGFQIPSRSPSPSAERLKNGRIAADEDIDDTEGKTAEEIHEMLAEREAKARATILEIVGDLPDAEIAPPENVLFVCKLNPVTTDDDLEIIFSRFGKIVGCEVIRDKISGDSLQYAFVEFDDKKSCEAAYFKMDNVLIDDRRIHVDFSQSVAKVQWRGKGRGLIYKDGEKHSGKLDFNNYKSSASNERKFRKNNDENPISHSRTQRYRSRSYERSTTLNRKNNWNKNNRSKSPHRNRDSNTSHRSKSRSRTPNRNRTLERSQRSRTRSRSSSRTDFRKQSSPTRYQRKEENVRDQYRYRRLERKQNEERNTYKHRAHSPFERNLETDRKYSNRHIEHEQNNERKSSKDSRKQHLKKSALDKKMKRKDTEKHKKNKHKNNKKKSKRKRASTTSESTSSSSSSDSSSSDSSSSESSSSSSDEKHRKRKKTKR